MHGPLVALKQLWDEALAPAKVVGQIASKNLSGDAYAQDPNQTVNVPAESVRSDPPIATVGGSASTHPPAGHSPADPVADQSFGQRKAKRQPRRDQ